MVPRVSVLGGLESVVIQYIMTEHVAEEAAHHREAKKQREAGGSWRFNITFKAACLAA